MPRTGLTPTEIKDKAVDLTMAQMRKDGFDQVKLTDIAKKIGVSHAALYSHFKDKTALFDAVSDRWLIKMDEELEAICRKPKPPVEKIQAWMIHLHRAKIAKILNDPELYKAFDMSAIISKPFVKRHMETMHSQLLGLVSEAIAKRRLKNIDAEEVTAILFAATNAFHHPKLVSQYIDVKREPLLKQVLESVLKGVRLL